MTDRPPKLCSMCHERMTVKNSTYCRECRTLYYREWYQKHREQLSQYQREYREVLRAVKDEEKEDKARKVKHERYYRPQRKSLWELEDEVRWKSLMV